MKLSLLGEIAIEVTPDSRPGLMNVRLGCENRKEVLVAQTHPDETIDHFCQRLRGMLRALMQGEERSPADKPIEKKKEKTWREQKVEIKNASGSGPLP
jgi:hypothetical protein